MLRVVQIGLGPIGTAIAARVRRQPGLGLVGAVDPRLAGRDLGATLGGARSDVEIKGAYEQLPTEARPDVVIHATGSFLVEVAEQLRSLARGGLAVVSTCEELAYPFYRHPDLSRELDSVARKAGAVLLGTGINPGFLMDKLPLTLMAACDAVRRVHVQRVVDAATRRESFQRKIGSGLAPDEFERRRPEGRMGHIGLAESAHMVADAMGVARERSLENELRPVLADKRIVTEFLAVESGQVCGIDQTVTIEAAGEERVRMDLQMYLGAERPRDAISVVGTPALELAIESGVPGDGGTAAVVVSCVRQVTTLEPGLRTMLDVPLRPGGLDS